MAELDHAPPLAAADGRDKCSPTADLPTNTPRAAGDPAATPSTDAASVQPPPLPVPQQLSKRATALLITPENMITNPEGAFCVSCRTFLWLPVFIQCKHTYCGRCADALSNDARCDSCQQPVGPGRYRVLQPIWSSTAEGEDTDMAMREVVSSRVRHYNGHSRACMCPSAECKWNGSPQQLRQHYVVCEHKASKESAGLKGFKGKAQLGGFINHKECHALWDTLAAELVNTYRWLESYGALFELLRMRVAIPRVRVQASYSPQTVSPRLTPRPAGAQSLLDGATGAGGLGGLTTGFRRSTGASDASPAVAAAGAPPRRRIMPPAEAFLSAKSRGRSLRVGGELRAAGVRRGYLAVSAGDIVDVVAHPDNAVFGFCYVRRRMTAAGERVLEQGKIPTVCLLPEHMTRAKFIKVLYKAQWNDVVLPDKSPTGGGGGGGSARRRGLDGTPRGTGGTTSRSSSVGLPGSSTGTPRSHRPPKPLRTAEGSGSRRQ